MCIQYLNAQQIYTALINDPLIRTNGRITFSLAGVNVNITTTDIVGNVIQSWFGAWLQSKNIYFRTRPNTQEFPDFILNPQTDIGSLLEVKCFNAAAGPGFDIANFDSYCDSLQYRAYRLDADYLVFSYLMDPNGYITINNIWLKKIWQLTSTSGPHPVRVQDKRGIIYNIRPTTFYSPRATQPFDTKEDFVKALYDTIRTYPSARFNADVWLNNVQKNYHSLFNEYLVL